MENEVERFQLCMYPRQHGQLKIMAKAAGYAPGRLCGEIIEAVWCFIMEQKRKQDLLYLAIDDDKLIRLCLGKLRGEVTQEKFDEAMQDIARRARA